ncbi:MAG TPA: iron-sulfur cluster assembly protein, partial [Steroidobacteraceae bacterium]|nr:iron-sulfur cluster assembly protein [Steroidobacteraceae bacterium]
MAHRIRRTLLNMTPETPVNAVRTALDAYTDPYLGETLGSAHAVRAVSAHEAGYTAQITLGYPVGGYRDE